MIKFGKMGLEKYFLFEGKRIWLTFSYPKDLPATQAKNIETVLHGIVSCISSIY